MKPFALLFIVIAACATGCAVPNKMRSEASVGTASIGSAEMKMDRTIVLRLRAETKDGAIGEGYFVYPPSDPEYQKILEHVAPLAPGQSALVRPWPDEKKPNSERSAAPERAAGRGLNKPVE